MKKIFKKLALFFLSVAAIGLWIPIFTISRNEEKIAVSSYEEEAEELVFPGQVVADKQVSVKFKTSGKLTWVGVKVGDKVKKGQILASLDKRELQKSFEKKANAYLSERWDFEQTQDNYQEAKDNHLITDAIKRILDKAQFDLNSSVLDYELAHLAIEYASLISPIDGIVISIDEPIAGVNITPATAKIIIADPASVYFLAEADEEDVVKIKEGDRGIIILDSYPDKDFESQIERIEFAPLSGTSGTVYGVKFPLPKNENLQFRLGMNGEVEIKQ